MVPKASKVMSCKSERIVGYLFSLERFDRLEVHSFLLAGWHAVDICAHSAIWVQSSSASLKGGYAEWDNLELHCLGTEDSEIIAKPTLCLDWKRMLSKHVYMLLVSWSSHGSLNDDGESNVLEGIQNLELLTDLRETLWRKVEVVFD